MFGSGVTFEGGKWLPDAMKLVVTNATLGLPGESVSCSEYQGPEKGWQLDESQQYGECKVQASSRLPPQQSA